MRPAPQARLALLVAAALFSTGGAAIKGCALSSWQVASFRSGIAALTFLAFVPAARRMLTRAEWLVGLCHAATMVSFVTANKLTTAANTIFLQATAPLYILLLAPWLLGERIRGRDVVFLCAMAAGLVLCFIDETQSSASAPNPVLGNTIAAFSGVGWAATVVGLRWLGKKGTGQGQAGDVEHGLGAVVAGNTLAFLVCLPFALPVEGARFAPDWIAVIYLGVFQIALAYLLVTRALRRVRAFEASLLLLVEPLLNPVWAFFLQGERPGYWTLVGGVVILSSTLLHAWSEARRGAAAERAIVD